MKFSKMFTGIDSHTMGEPTRIITGGLPNIPGRTMAEKKQHLIDNMDHIRTALMNEPRGHKDMFGSIVTAPCNENADFGIIFMDGGGYLNMCGHGSIGAVTAAIETGMVKAEEPLTKVVMDTPAGLISATARVESGQVFEVSIVNVPSFVFLQDAQVDVPGIGRLGLDIAFGGSFFAIVPSKELGLSVEPANAGKFLKLGLKIRQSVNEQISIKHPELSHITSCDLVEFYDNPTHPKAKYKNVVVFGQGQIDRSPCGTGTSAKLATLFAKGEIKEGQDFVYESIIGTLFKGVVLGESSVGGYQAIIPEITGSAFITGLCTFLIDERDPVKHGFVI